jgi:LmbE family N-acetylglucosaminyl deacetylase
MVRAFRRLKPKVVLTHQLNDSHPDHNNIAQLIRECSRLSAMKNFDSETGAEKTPPPIIAHNVFSRLVPPSFIVDVTEFHESKMEAIRAHRSQFYDSSSTEPETMLTGKRFLDDIASRSRYFGTLIGVEYGEPFYVREALNVDDPFALLTRPMNLYS